MIGVMKEESQQQSKGTCSMLKNTTMIQLNMDPLTGSATLKNNQRKGIHCHMSIMDRKTGGWEDRELGKGVGNKKGIQHLI